MGSTFNPQILVEKLAKLNNSQASIESILCVIDGIVNGFDLTSLQFIASLSHWCIFHMNKAQQVVETWARQFHCSPREQRLAFLYLANDILQNSRRKGSEFVGEFWRVLPDALRDVVQSGDDFGRNAALRLIGIWEERKVFGSRAQILKEELIGKPLDSSNRNGKHFCPKLKQVAGLSMDKIVSGYQAVYGSHIDEDVILGKCRNAISYLEKVEKEVGTDINSGKFHGSSIMEELQGQHSVLRDCIEHLLVVESSRATLVSHLKEALREQESKLDQVRNQLQAAQSQSEQTGNTCRQLLNNVNAQSRVEQNSMESHTSMAPHSFPSFPGKSGNVEDDPRKSAAAAVAAKLTASTSSAQMLSYVLSSLASEGVIGNPVRDPSGSIDYPSEKRHKLEIDQTPYMNNPQPFSQPETMPHNQQQYTPTNLPPPPSSSPPPLPPIPPVQQYPVAQFMPSASGQYAYSLIQQPQQVPLPAYPTIGAPATGISPYTMPTNSYQNLQSSEGNLYNQPSSLPMAPISRQ